MDGPSLVSVIHFVLIMINGEAADNTSCHIKTDFRDIKIAYFLFKAFCLALHPMKI